MILDFAENYSFLVQDAIQGFYWQNAQATLHPFGVYYMDNGEIKSLSLCCISDCLIHNTNSVFAFQTKVLTFLKQKFPGVRKVVYFSDGAAAQYKNFKNFTNLCFHERDFQLSAEWHFFATSHGKNICDGIGGTTKRLAARASLQAPSDGQILTPQQLFAFCQEHIKNITYFFVPESDITSLKTMLEERFKSSKTIPGTRYNHCYVPVSNYQLFISRMSGDDNHFLASIGTPIR